MGQGSVDFDRESKIYESQNTSSRRRARRLKHAINASLPVQPEAVPPASQPAVPVAAPEPAAEAAGQSSVAFKLLTSEDPIGFEAQKHQAERHEIAKLTHQIDLFKKDMIGQEKLTDLVIAHAPAARDIPGFEAKYLAELEKRGLDKEWWQPKSTTQAA